MKNRIFITDKRDARGFTLMELMIAMLIGTLLLSGAMTLFISNKRIYREVEDLGRVQENIRFAMDILVRDIRLAGYKGCKHDADMPGGAALAGTDGSATTLPDQITVRHLGTTHIADYLTGSSFTSTTNHTLKKNNTITIFNCNGVEAHQISNVQADTPSAGTTTYTLATTPSKELRNGEAKVRTLSSTTFSISNRQLMMNGDVLLGNVENMQILYGEDTSTPRDGIPDTYVATGAVTNFDNVVSVRLALLFRTANANQDLGPDTTTFDMLGTTIPAANDRFRRRMLTSTIQLRNRTGNI